MTADGLVQLPGRVLRPRARKVCVCARAPSEREPGGSAATLDFKEGRRRVGGGGSRFQLCLKARWSCLHSNPPTHALPQPQRRPRGGDGQLLAQALPLPTWEQQGLCIGNVFRIAATNGCDLGRRINVLGFCRSVDLVGEAVEDAVLRSGGEVVVSSKQLGGGLHETLQMTVRPTVVVDRVRASSRRLLYCQGHSTSPGRSGLPLPPPHAPPPPNTHARAGRAAPPVWGAAAVCAAELGDRRGRWLC